MYHSLDRHLLNEVINKKAEDAFGLIPNTLPCPEYTKIMGMNIMMYDIHSHKVYKLINFLKYRMDGQWCIMAQIEQQLNDFSLIVTNVIWQRYLSDNISHEDEMCNNFRLFSSTKDMT